MSQGIPTVACKDFQYIRQQLTPITIKQWQFHGPSGHDMVPQSLGARDPLYPNMHTTSKFKTKVPVFLGH